MKNTFLAITLFFSIGLMAQNLSLVSHVSYGDEGCSEVWGLVHTNGIEYACAGYASNVVVYSLEDPANPVELEVIPVEGARWNDIKSFGNYFYHVSEANNGMVIIDMSNLDSIRHQYYKPTVFGGTLSRAHNISIDEYGYLYVCSHNVAGGTLMFDLNEDPFNPTLAGNTSTYAHDLVVIDNIMYASKFTDGVEIIDVQDKSNPVILQNVENEQGNAHNSWPSDDGNILFTSTERQNAFIEALDISDFSNVNFLDKIDSETSIDESMPHNMFFLDNYLICSWYSEGIFVIDAHRPSNLVQMAHYDTYPDGPGIIFDGCWGNYPFFPSGYILASDNLTGLFVLKPAYGRASYLEGSVIDKENGQAINGADVKITSLDKNEQTNAGGIFKMGTAEPGTYEVVVSAENYSSQIIEVEMMEGEVTILDVELEKNPVSTADVGLDINLDIFPNPFSDELHIQIKQKGIYRVSVQTQQGKILKNEDIQSSGVLSLEELPSGVYLLRVESLESTKVQSRTIVKN